jgi:hypothetical protein
VILFGIPYQYTLSHVLKARLNFMREKHFIKDNDYLTFDALRQSSQCIGRIIRSKVDYGIVILADIRYNRSDKKSKFPPWITQFLKETSLNISTDIAIEQIKQFLKQVGQPIEEEALKSILYDEKQIEGLNALIPSYSSFLLEKKKVVEGNGLTELLGREEGMEEKIEKELAMTRDDVMLMDEGEKGFGEREVYHKGLLLNAEEEGEEGEIGNEEDWNMLHEMEMIQEVSSTKKRKVEETSIPMEMSISGSNIVNTRTLEVPKIIVERNKVPEKWTSKFLFADDEDDE